MNISLMEH
jgi:hypothetical protein